MLSFIPRSVTRYRRDHPYTHPLLFFIVDCTNSCLQMAFIGLVAYWSYTSINRWHSSADNVQGQDTSSVQTAQQSSAVPRLIVASSTTASTPGKISNDLSAPLLKRDKPKTLLNGKYAVRWILSQPESGFTIQFGASVDKAALIDFANLHLSRGAVVYPFKQTSGNQTLYGVASGLYNSIPSALIAIDNMPTELVAYDPWIRPIHKLQQQVANL